MNIFKNRIERNLIVGSSWEVRPGRTREISLTGSTTPVGKNSVRIKSWPCILIGPLLNSWLPPSMKLDAQFSENCAQRGFFLSKLSKHDSSASESAFPSILTVIRFPALFLNYKFDVYIEFHPPSRIAFSTANSTVLVYVTHCMLSLVHHWPIVDPPLLIHRWSNH